MTPAGVPAGEASRLRAEPAVAADPYTELEAALVSSPRIGLAVGIMVERYELTAEAAFGVLRQDGALEVGACGGHAPGVGGGVGVALGGHEGLTVLLAGGGDAVQDGVSADDLEGG